MLKTRFFLCKYLEKRWGCCSFALQNQEYENLYNTGIELWGTNWIIKKSWLVNSRWAKAFGLVDDSIFCSWLHTLNYIRNICAHHARLWNVHIDVIPKKYYNKTNKIWMTDNEVDCAQSSKIYYSLCIIMYLLQTINPSTKFRQHFYDLLGEYPNVNTVYMGFPKEWEKMSLWKNNWWCIIMI